MGALSVTVVVRAGENGLLVKPGDAESLADGIERLCNDGALCEGLAKAVRTDYEEKLFLRCLGGTVLQFLREALR